MNTPIIDLEDVLEGLTADLSRKGIVTVSHQDQEIVRYRRQSGESYVEIGVRQEHGDSEISGYNIIALFVSSSNENVRFPSDDKMNRVLGKYADKQFRHASFFEREGEYDIAFRRYEIDAENMRGVLRQAIRYMCQLNLHDAPTEFSMVSISVPPVCSSQTRDQSGSGCFVPAERFVIQLVPPYKG